MSLVLFSTLLLDFGVLCSPMVREAHLLLEGHCKRKVARRKGRQQLGWTTSAQPRPWNPTRASGGGAVSRLAITGLIACQDACLCDACSSPWAPPSTHCSTWSDLRSLLALQSGWQANPLSSERETLHNPCNFPQNSSLWCTPSSPYDGHSVIRGGPSAHERLS